eukprot:PhF_6_TR6309/c0_g1_i1/m.9562
MSGRIPFFEHKVWLEQWLSATKSRNGTAIRDLRVQIIHNTLDILEHKCYVDNDGNVVNLPPVAPVSYKCYESMAPRPLKRYPNTQIFVEEDDCLVVHKKLLDHGLNPVVLNMASAKRPGGGYLSGAGAQEENLFRRSSYSLQLLPKDYPLDNCVMYTQDVLVFRDSEANGYALLPAPIKTSFIACAAKSHPMLVNNTTLCPADAANLKEKIRLLLSAAVDQGHDSMVLSALGCGAFCNPPNHVAKIFHEVITNHFPEAFHTIVFAIFDDHNARKEHNPEGNVAPFRKVFGISKKLPVSREETDVDEGVEVISSSKKDVEPAHPHGTSGTSLPPPQQGTLGNKNRWDNNNNQPLSFVKPSGTSPPPPPPPQHGTSPRPPQHGTNKTCWNNFDKPLRFVKENEKK